MHKAFEDLFSRGITAAHIIAEGIHPDFVEFYAPKATAPITKIIQTFSTTTNTIQRTSSRNRRPVAADFEAAKPLEMQSFGTQNRRVVLELSDSEDEGDSTNEEEKEEVEKEEGKWYSLTNGGNTPQLVAPVFSTHKTGSPATIQAQYEQKMEDLARLKAEIARLQTMQRWLTR